MNDIVPASPRLRLRTGESDEELHPVSEDVRPVLSACHAMTTTSLCTRFCYDRTGPSIPSVPCRDDLLADQLGSRVVAVYVLKSSRLSTSKG